MARQKENKRPTPVRLGSDAWAAVTAMREALGDLRGVDAEKVTVTEAVELLLTQNIEAIKAMAENPEELPEADGGVIDVPQQFWDGLPAPAPRFDGPPAPQRDIADLSLDAAVAAWSVPG